MKIRDIMTDNPETVSPGTTIAEVARLMRDLNVGIVPVVDEDQLLGVITDRDITIRVTADGLAPHDVSVQDYVSPNPITVSPDDSVDQARNLMSEHQIRRLLVTEGEKLVGIVSLGDVATRDQTADAKTGGVLEEISEPTQLNRTS